MSKKGPLKPGKQVIIDFIGACLEKGEQRAEILGKVGEKWKTSKSAYDRLAVIARQELTERQEAVKKHLAEVDQQAAVSARKKAIMGADERRVYLTKIVLGKIKLPYTEVKWNSKDEKFETIKFVEHAPHSSRISAIAELNKMDGSYAPINNKFTLGDDGSEFEITIGKKKVEPATKKPT